MCCNHVSAVQKWIVKLIKPKTCSRRRNDGYLLQEFTRSACDASWIKLKKVKHDRKETVSENKTHNVREAESYQCRGVFRIRDKLLHFVRVKSSPVAVDKICLHDSLSPERTIQLSNTLNIQMYYISRINQKSKLSCVAAVFIHSCKQLILNNMVVFRVTGTT